MEKENHIQILDENLKSSVRMLNVGQRSIRTTVLNTAKVAKDGPHQNLHFSMNLSLRTGGGTSLRQEANTFCVIVPILSRGGWMWGSSWFNQTFEQNITTLTRFGYGSRKVIFFVCVIISYVLSIIRSWCWPDLTFTSHFKTDLFLGLGLKSFFFNIRPKEL